MASSKGLVDYRQTLDAVAIERYKEKCALINNIDPYQVDKAEWCKDTDMWANVTCADIFMYLVNFTSTYTLDELKSYKSLDAYNQFINGWVRVVAVCKINNLCLHTARVSHSVIILSNKITIVMLCLCK